jgi:hypothetical protein
VELSWTSREKGIELEVFRENENGKLMFLECRNVSKLFSFITGATIDKYRWSGQI